MKIEAGKFYRTRSGRKVQVLSTDGGSKDFSVYASLVLPTGKLDQPDCWREDGLFVNAGTPNGKDLVAEWIDKPEFDWSVIPPWLNYLAKDRDGLWHLYQFKPTLGNYLWSQDHPEGVDLVGSCPIPAAFAPHWSGSPEDSLVERNPAK